MEVVVRAITGGGLLPVPDNVTEVGLPAALWAIAKEADFAPVDADANVTVKSEL